MPGVGLFFAGLFYAAGALFVLGLAFKIAQYARTPAPLKIPTTPAPTTRGGVALRLAREVCLFESLFASERWLWLFAMLFHAGMAVALLRHLRYFTEPVWFWVALIQPAGIYAGMAMVAGLCLLLARRFLIDRVRYITNPSDILMLLLLIGIGASGLGIKYLAHTDIVLTKAYFLGLMRFSVEPLPADPLLLIHLGLVALLMAIFPFSKLLHAPGVFFSPSRNQADDPREKRHIAPWAAAQYDSKAGGHG